MISEWTNLGYRSFIQIFGGLNSILAPYELKGYYITEILISESPSGGYSVFIGAHCGPRAYLKDGVLKPFMGFVWLKLGLTKEGQESCRVVFGPDYSIPADGCLNYINEDDFPSSKDIYNAVVGLIEVCSYKVRKPLHKISIKVSKPEWGFFKNSYNPSTNTFKGLSEGFSLSGNLKEAYSCSYRVVPALYAKDEYNLDFYIGGTENSQSFALMGCERGYYLNRLGEGSCLSLSKDQINDFVHSSELDRFNSVAVSNSEIGSDVPVRISTVCNDSFGAALLGFCKHEITDVIFGRLEDYKNVVSTHIGYRLKPQGAYEGISVMRNDSLYSFYVEQGYSKIVYILSTNKIYAPVNCSLLFKEMSSLRRINFGNLDLHGTRKSPLFTGCTALEEVDFGEMDIKSLERCYGIFSGCSRLKTMYIRKRYLGSVNTKMLLKGCPAELIGTII